MPQMGESVTEGTIVRWIKKVGDQIDRDEPLFEITTDKVDAEIPSPVAGILTEVLAKEGDTVSVNTVVCMIQQSDEAPRQEAAPARAPAPETTATPHVAHLSSSGETREPPSRQKSSPLVRRIAREHNVDVGRIAGSGLGGRVTKQDILEYLGRAQESEIRDQGFSASEPRPPMEGDRADIQPLSPMRKRIAEHMILSRRTSAHVHSVFHVDFSGVERIRQQKKGKYEQLGAKLTYMAFISKAVIEALRRHPIVNASLDGDNILYKKDVNLGIAVALEGGLIVPVIKNADEKNMLGLSRAIADVAERARVKQLKPEDVHGGTFTITNPGQFGAQFGLPIINQPQVAILGVGTIERRPVVVDNGIAIRTMAYLTLGYDHRLVDGAVADQFMSDVKKHLEHFDPDKV